MTGRLQDDQYGFAGRRYMTYIAACCRLAVDSREPFDTFHQQLLSGVMCIWRSPSSLSVGCGPGKSYSHVGSCSQ